MTKYKKMRILELQEYAKDNGWDSLKFKFVSLNGQTKTCKWIDAYYGIFQIDSMPENEMITVSAWIQLFGDEQFEFQVIEEQEEN